MARRNLAIILTLSVICNLLFLNQLIRREAISIRSGTMGSAADGGGHLIAELAERGGRLQQISEAESLKKREASSPNGDNNESNQNYNDFDGSLNFNESKQKQENNIDSLINSNDGGINGTEQKNHVTLTSLIEKYLKQKLIFVVGAMSSGTTLMRLILDVHPDVNCGDETKIVNLMLEFVDSVYRDRFNANFMKSSGVKNDTIDKVIF